MQDENNKPAIQSALDNLFSDAPAENIQQEPQNEPTQEARTTEETKPMSGEPRELPQESAEDTQAPIDIKEASEDFPEDAPTTDANKAWRALRKQLKEAKAELARREAASISGDTNEIEKWKSKYETADAELGRANLERSTAFREKYDDVMREKVAELGELGVESNKLREFILEERTDDEIAEDLGSMSPASRLKAFQLVNDYKKLLEERKQALEEWKQTRDTLDTREKEEKRKKTVESVSKNLNSAIQDALESGNAFYAPVESNKDWEVARKKRVSELQTILEANDPKQIARYVAAGLTTRDYQSAYTAANNQLNEARKEIANLRRRLKLDEGATPYVSGGEPPKQSGRDPNESYSVAEGVRRWFSNF